MSRTLSRSQERHFSAHHMLLRAGRSALERAEKQGNGCLYDELAAMVFSALAIEAFSNSLGSKVIPGWLKNHERKSPMNKLKLLAEQLSITYDESQEPWSGARFLMEFRNEIAHPKPQFITETIFLSQEEHDARSFDMPQSELERKISLVEARTALTTAGSVIDSLLKPLGDEQKFGLSVEGWSGSTRLRTGDNV
jgi:hypothetical protein